MSFDRKQITHLGLYESGTAIYMRKNKCGQWNVLELDRKGYRWSMINYLNFPDKIVKVTQEDIKDHLFESTRCFKSK